DRRRVGDRKGVARRRGATPLVRVSPSRRQNPVATHRSSIHRQPTHKELIMHQHIVRFCQAATLSLFIGLSTQGVARADDGAVAESGIIKVKSAYGKAETITRIKQDISAKGIRFFDEIDQAKLAADAGIQIRPSTLLVFGNPPLGTLFIRSNPLAG